MTRYRCGIDVFGTATEEFDGGDPGRVESRALAKTYHLLQDQYHPL